MKKLIALMSVVAFCAAFSAEAACGCCKKDDAKPAADAKAEGCGCAKKADAKKEGCGCEKKADAKKEGCGCEKKAETPAPAPAAK